MGDILTKDFKIKILNECHKEFAKDFCASFLLIEEKWKQEFISDGSEILISKFSVEKDNTFVLEIKSFVYLKDMEMILQMVFPFYGVYIEKQ